jgi:hypothetical protein
MSSEAVAKHQFRHPFHTFWGVVFEWMPNKFLELYVIRSRVMDP